jgi:hypothetical protein
MDSMYLPLEASYNGLRTIDVDKLKFRYSWMDIQAAAKKLKKRFHKTEEVKVYPDTTVWIKDFAYSTTSQCIMTISGIKLGDYPVVSKWTQKAFVLGEHKKKQLY